MDDQEPIATAQSVSEYYLTEAAEQLAAVVDQSESFSNVGLYPFENIHTSLLLSIAYSLQSLNEKLDALANVPRPVLFEIAPGKYTDSITEYQIAVTNQVAEQTK